MKGRFGCLKEVGFCLVVDDSNEMQVVCTMKNGGGVEIGEGEVHMEFVRWGWGSDLRKSYVL